MAQNPLPEVAFIPSNHREPREPGGVVTIQVPDDEDITVYFANLFREGSNEWLHAPGRFPRFNDAMSWKECRQVFMPAIRRFWEELDRYTRTRTAGA
jgi:hypothetical protein